MIELPWAILRATDDALMARQYMPQRRLLGPLHLAWHPTLREPEWNRIRILRPVSDLGPRLQDALSLLAAFGGGCVAVEPDTPTGVVQILRTLAYRPMFQHSWVLYGLEPGLGSDDLLPNALHIEELTSKRTALFRNLFHAGFATYQHGPETLTAWDVALQNILQQAPLGSSDEHGTSQLRHCLARWHGEPAGIASYGVRGAVAGFYNLTVHPRFRGHGIGGHLMRYRRRRAQALGAEVGFLQSQDDTVLQWHLRGGAQQGPVVQGWGPSTRPEPSAI